ncbi:MAG: hypothetical protein ABJA71_03560 [Ginsengibacter sp.]
MKKFIVSILAVFYLGSSIGASVHLHYCMDKLIGWSLEHSKNDRCNKCDMSKRQNGKGCCKDEYKQLKLQNDQKAAASYQTLQLSLVAIPAHFFALTLVNLPSIAEENPLNHAPPGSENIPLYIRNRVFRI